MRKLFLLFFISLIHVCYGQLSIKDTLIDNTKYTVADFNSTKTFLLKNNLDFKIIEDNHLVSWLIDETVALDVMFGKLNIDVVKDEDRDLIFDMEDDESSNVVFSNKIKAKIDNQPAFYKQVVEKLDNEYYIEASYNIFSSKRIIRLQMMYKVGTEKELVESVESIIPIFQEYVKTGVFIR